MVQLQKAQILYQLYQLKSLGYEYIKETEITQNATKFSHDMPNSLEQMQDMVKLCHLCSLAKTRKNTIFGEGNPNAKILFIGEGPSANEDEIGKHFTGKAGQLLVKIIENVLELKKEEVYITTIVKCRLPNNRVPTIEEADACKAYILQQIKIIKPKIIVALGSSAYHHLTKDFKSTIQEVRGEIFDFYNTKLIPTYNPSFLLRNPSSKKEVYQDMLRIKALL